MFKRAFLMGTMVLAIASCGGSQVGILDQLTGGGDSSAKVAAVEMFEMRNCSADYTSCDIFVVPEKNIVVTTPRATKATLEESKESGDTTTRTVKAFQLMVKDELTLAKTLDAQLEKAVACAIDFKPEALSSYYLKFLDDKKAAVAFLVKGGNIVCKVAFKAETTDGVIALQPKDVNDTAHLVSIKEVADITPLTYLVVENKVITTPKGATVDR